jgi:hypothetical protein
MPWISTWFLWLGALAGASGMALGIFMAAAGDHSQMPLHAHINLVGWVTMMLYGLFYRALPEAADGALPRVQFILSIAGLIAMIPGLALIDSGDVALGAPFAKTGAVLTIVAMLIFVATVFRWTRPHATRS